MALPAAPPAMIVLKGYHVGSKWFAESFNALPGGAFFFEYEHCLREMGRKQQEQHSSSRQRNWLEFLVLDSRPWREPGRDHADHEVS